MSRFAFNPITSEFYLVDMTSGAKFVSNGYTLELWYKGTKVQEWAVAAPTIESGNPIGLLLSLTYTIA